jgi:hypothetical protein
LFIACNLRREQRLEYMLGKKADDGHDDTVTHQMVGVIVSVWKNIALVETHEPRSFPRGQKSRPNRGPVDDDDRLATRTADWRPETSCEIIEPDFRTLPALAVGVYAGALVNPAHHCAAHFLRLSDFAAMERSHKRQQSACLIDGMPFNSLRVLIDQIRENCPTRRWRWEAPPDPSGLRPLR